MRASEHTESIVAAIEAIGADDPMTVGDRFSYQADQTPGEPRPERTFRLEILGLSPPVSFTTAQFVAHYRLVFTYTATTGVGKRILDDGERVITALIVLYITTGVVLVFESDWEPFLGTQPGEVEVAIRFRGQYGMTGVAG